MATVRFDRVTTMRPWWFPVIALAVLAPIGALYLTVAYPSVPGLALTCALYFGAVFGVFTLLGRPVTTTIDRAGLAVRIGRREHRYAPSDILGFYSYDVRRLSRYTTSICLHFRDGERIDITDYSWRPASLDPVRRERLHDFVRAMDEELGFVPVSDSRLRKFLWVGYTWFERRSR